MKKVGILLILFILSGCFFSKTPAPQPIQENINEVSVNEPTEPKPIPSSIVGTEVEQPNVVVQADSIIFTSSHPEHAFSLSVPKTVRVLEDKVIPTADGSTDPRYRVSMQAVNPSGKPELGPTSLDIKIRIFDAVTNPYGSSFDSTDELRSYIGSTGSMFAVDAVSMVKQTFQEAGILTERYEFIKDNALYRIELVAPTDTASAYFEEIITSLSLKGAASQSFWMIDPGFSAQTPPELLSIDISDGSIKKWASYSHQGANTDNFIIPPRGNTMVYYERGGPESLGWTLYQENVVNHQSNPVMSGNRCLDGPCDTQSAFTMYMLNADGTKGLYVDSGILGIINVTSGERQELIPITPFTGGIDPMLSPNETYVAFKPRIATDAQQYITIIQTGSPENTARLQLPEPEHSSLRPLQPRRAAFSPDENYFAVVSYAFDEVGGKNNVYLSIFNVATGNLIDHEFVSTENNQAGSGGVHWLSEEDLGFALGETLYAVHFEANAATITTLAKFDNPISIFRVNAQTFLVVEYIDSRRRILTLMLNGNRRIVRIGSESDPNYYILGPRD